LAVCIEQTKSEIAALRPTGTENDRLLVVANELDAIVEATENATQTILEAAEKLDGLSQQLAGSKDSDPFVKSVADEIGDTIITIYEACNFQDITGQRISKVVKTLEFVEQRVMAMITIWGDEAIAELQPTANETHASEEAALLNGPQLASNAISQDDIDKLFG
jgi:chemotaxis protein CheZ